nr:MAG TPA: hypothetical protein [Caudoviricetes sp.]
MLSYYRFCPSQYHCSTWCNHKQYFLRVFFHDFLRRLVRQQANEVSALVIQP